MGNAGTRQAQVESLQTERDQLAQENAKLKTDLKRCAEAMSKVAHTWVMEHELWSHPHQPSNQKRSITTGWLSEFR